MHENASYLVLILRIIEKDLFLADGTQSKYGQVMYVSFEPVVLDKGLLQREQLVLRKVEHFPAFGTYEMVVPAVLFGVIADDAISDADLGRQAKLFQQLKRAIDSRNIGVGVFFPQPLEYFLCADVPFSAVKRVHHHDALGRETITFCL